jgi:hypothetical protein
MPEPPVETINLGGRLPIPTPATKVGSEPVDRPAPEESDDDPPEPPAEDFDIPIRGNPGGAESSDEQSLDIQRDFTPIEPQTEAERNHRRSTIHTIKQYRTLFGEHLSDLNLENLGQRSESELNELLEDVSWLISCRNSVKSSRGIFIAAMSLAEGGAPVVGLNLRGLSTLCQSSPDLMTAVDEVAVKRGALPTSPESRLLIALGGLVMQLDSHNKRLDQLATSSQPEQPPQGSAPQPDKTGSLPAPTKPRASAEGL